MTTPSNDPLAFTPVLRRGRVDGWTAERQRAFIEALAVTGSPGRAAAALGKSATGAIQLRSAPGGESFSAAWDRALAMAAQNGRAQLDAGLGAVRAEHAAWAPPPWSHAGGSRPAQGRSAPFAAEVEDEDDMEAAAEFVEVIARKYVIKLEQEREARMAGEIAAADFYIRQVTALEVALDLTSGGNGLAILAAARREGRSYFELAETPMSRLLDDLRRAHFEACGDPPRPGPPPDYLLQALADGSAAEPLEAISGGDPRSYEQQRRLFEERHAEAAKEQIAWEAEARGRADKGGGDASKGSETSDKCLP